MAATDLPAAAAAWASTRQVRVGASLVRYREAGTGAAVVLVHGLGMASDYWARTAPAVAAAGYRVLAPDLPGFGESTGAEDGLAIGAQAAALRAWASAMEVGAAVYVGHSLSCQSVLELAALDPGRVRALVLAAPTGDGGRVRMAREAWRLFRDAWREDLSLLVYAGHAYLRAGPRRFWRTWRSGAEHDLLPLLPRVAVPALVVVGDRDPVVPCDFAASIVEHLPDARLAVIAGGTHAVFYHRPDRFNQLVLEFLAGL